MADTKKESLRAERLVREQLITEEDLAEARKREQVSGTAWYRQLIHMGKLDFTAVNDLLHYEFHLSKSTRKSHESLGAELVRRKVLSKKDLDRALADQRRKGKLLGAILIGEGYVSREDIAMVLADQYGLDYADLESTPSDAQALSAVPESFAKKKHMIPVALEGDKLTVLIAGPQAPERLKDAEILLGLRLRPMVTAVEDMNAEIDSRYHGVPVETHTLPKGLQRPSRKSAEISVQRDQSEFMETLEEPEAPTVKEVEEEMAVDLEQEQGRFEDIVREAQGAPVVKLVSTIVEGAVNSSATDVHLDPQEPEMRVRYRIDGVLHDVMSIPEEIENAVISRLKILADIDISETRRPQDGHISMEVGGDEFDVRVATLPTYLGERIVLRLLDQSSVLAGVNDLGMEEDDRRSLSAAIEEPYGMILVTGPTGSGKTTTLYSCLNEKNVMTDSIVTLEDPVEYQLSGINQVQIDPDIELTFANVLRASLRQDIDVLLVGEIRDPETARIAIRAAMTGHLVFSTLHTNDAPEAISTLRNMDIPSYLLSSALAAIVGQRLVRKICSDCKKAFKPTKALLKSVKLPESTARLYRGKGCETCYHTGSRGRTGIFEVVDVNDPIRKLIAADASVAKIAQAAKLKTMADRCRLKVKRGIVTPEEFLRVVRT